ncbi:MAG: hypothetical protein HUJ66_01175 [Oscillospiraceae bacterium]|nr:hypothetical protein [Oscillospiraceae bacterium]
MENKTVIVVGAVNMDICGRPFKAPAMKDSNPAAVTTVPGGVGRNIAHNLRLLDLNVKLVTAVGDDDFGAGVMRSCKELGIDMSLARRVKGGKTSTYMYITDEKGEMLLAACDSDIAAYISPEYLTLLKDELNSADAVVVEANLSEEALKWIGANVTVPLYADTVSRAKAHRLLPIIDRLTALKPNEIEALGITGERSALLAAEALLRKGVKRVFVTLGSEGLLAVEDGEIVKLPCMKTNVVNTTGCGDAAISAIVWSGVQGLSLAETADAATRAAALVSQCEETVNTRLSPKILM